MNEGDEPLRIEIDRSEGFGERLLGLLLDRAHEVPPHLVAPLVAEEITRHGRARRRDPPQDYEQLTLVPLPACGWRRKTLSGSGERPAGSGISRRHGGRGAPARRHRDVPAAVGRHRPGRRDGGHLGPRGRQRPAAAATARGPRRGHPRDQGQVHRHLHAGPAAGSDERGGGDPVVAPAAAAHVRSPDRACGLPGARVRSRRRQLRLRTERRCPAHRRDRRDGARPGRRGDGHGRDRRLPPRRAGRSSVSPKSTDTWTRSSPSSSAPNSS
ncbi:hypothetical protein ACU686_16150 [Yinghuangia aomiensis]